MKRRLLAALVAALTLAAVLPAPAGAYADSASAQRTPPMPDDRSGGRWTPQPGSLQRPSTVSAPVTATAVPCDDTFRAVSSPSPGTSSNFLTAVSDTWAVGGAQATGFAFQTLTEHWDGIQWTVVSSPNNAGENVLYGVAAISASDVWAVGYWTTGTGTAAVLQPLIEHWNGTSWVTVSVAAQGAGDNVLLAVSANSSTDVWAVGFSRSSNTTPRIPLTWHWDGVTWTNRTAPTQGAGSHVFYGVASALGAVWAVGYWRPDDTTVGNRHPLLELWNGTAWVAGSAPLQGTGDTVLFAVAAVSAGDFWTVGYQRATSTAPGQNLTYHYPGPAGSTAPWVYVSSPNPSTTLNSLLAGVAATPAGDVWAVGNYGTVSPFQGQALQWNGTAWNLVTVATIPGHTELNGAWAVSKAAVLAVGDYHNGTIFQTLVEQLCDLHTPSAPTGVTASQFAWNGGMNVSWQAPAQNGGAPVSSYRVTVYIGGVVSDTAFVNGSPPATTTQYYGSSFGSNYTFTVAAYNPAGWSAESAPSNSVALITSPYPPNSLRTLAGNGEATVIWTPTQAVGRPITGWTVSAFRQGFPGTGPTITLPGNASSATINGLTNGVAYSVDVSATNAFGNSGSTVAGPVTPIAVPLGSAKVVLPAIANGAYGGYTTVTQIQNVSSTAANVTVKYFDANGTPVGTGNSVAALPANASWLLRNDNPGALPAASAGSAIVYSDQPIAAFVNEFAPGDGDATSYTAISPVSGVGTTLYAPTIANNAYGGYTTGVGLMNIGTVATNITITYRDGTGSVVKTQTLTGVAAGAYRGLYSGDATLALPNGFAGTATIQSSAGNLAAIVNETGPGGQFSSYDALPVGSTTLYAPVALNNAFGGYNTGMGIQNTTAAAGTVTINYYDASGTATTKTFPIGPYGSLGVYQGTDIPVAGAYTARLTSTVAIAAIVNEVAPSTTSAKQSTAYNTFAAGSSSLHLPLVESAGPDGWSTGEGIMNTGTAATMVTVTYYDTITGVQVGTPQSLTLQPNAFWGLYQPTGGLPSGMRASAVVTTAAGGQVAVICNESNATSFMSYTGT
jgi:hypothetical protein